MRKKIGGEILGDSGHFCVWCPHAEKVEVILKDRGAFPLEKDHFGYWETEIPVSSPALYKFKVNSKEFPDPASRFQPDGVHSWSQLAGRDFRWEDEGWEGLSTSQMIIYELHVGCFSKEGTFDGIREKLDHLLELGVNTLELMPIAQFAGTRNWGYDGVYPFAVQNSYGSRESLKHLIDECHRKGIAVLLDVVYNHTGPEGNYLSFFAPYFTEKYSTPWGKALNFDDEYSDGVRNYFIQNALMWLEEFHFDGLRLDAVHEIIDRGAHHFLQELSEAVDELENRTGRTYVLIAESDLNDTRIVNSYEKGGFGLEAQWVDDFHHSLHTYLTGENNGYYSDYGKLENIKKTLQQAFVYDGDYSTFRKKTVGNSPEGCYPHNFLVSIQNHDQIGNRLLGERLGHLISFEALKLSAGILLISPYVPMLFMGEEFAEKNPFQYFVSHTDPELIRAVEEGRKKEFEYFIEEKAVGFPEPQSVETFERSKIGWDFKKDPSQNSLFEYYRYLIRLRKKGKFSAFTNKSKLVEIKQDNLICISGKEEGKQLLALANFGSGAVKATLPPVKKSNLLFCSSDKQWGGKLNYEDQITTGEIEVQGTSVIVLEVVEKQKS